MSEPNSRSSLILPAEETSLSDSEDEVRQILVRLDRNVPPNKLSLIRLLLTANGVPNDEDVQKIKDVSDLCTAIKRNISAFPVNDAVSVLQYVLEEAGVPVGDYGDLRCDRDSVDACRKEAKLATLLLCLFNGLSNDEFDILKDFAQKRIDTHPDIVPTREQFFRVCIYLRIFEEEKSLEEFGGWLKDLERLDLAKIVEEYIEKNVIEREDSEAPSKFLKPVSETQSQKRFPVDPRRRGFVSGTKSSDLVPVLIQATRDNGILIFHQVHPPTDTMVQSGNPQKMFLDQSEILLGQYTIQFAPVPEATGKQSQRHKSVNDETVSCCDRLSFKLIVSCNIVGLIIISLLTLTPSAFTSYVGFAGKVNETSRNFLFYPGEVRQIAQTGLFVSGLTVTGEDTTASIQFNFEHVSQQTFESLKERRSFSCREENFNVSDYSRFSIPRGDCRIPFTMLMSSLMVSVRLLTSNRSATHGSLHIFDDQSKVNDFLTNGTTQDAIYNKSLTIGTKEPETYRLSIPVPNEGHYYPVVDLPLGVQVLSLNVSASVVYINGTNLTMAEQCSLDTDKKLCSTDVGSKLSASLLLGYYPELSDPGQPDAVITVNDTPRFNFHSMKIIGIVLFVMYIVVLFIGLFASGLCCYLKRRQSRQVVTP